MEEECPQEQGQELLDCDPAPNHETIEEILETAVEFHGSGNVERAADIYRTVLECVPENLQANFNLATICHSTGDMASAITCYQKVLEYDPVNFQVLYFLAGAYQDQGYFEMAVNTYRKAMESNPHHADTCYNLGVIHQLRDEFKLAYQCYQQAVSLDPEHVRAFYNLGIISYESGEDDDAAMYYQKVIDLSPGDVDAHYNLALVHTRSGRSEEGVECYMRALDLTPEDSELHNSLGLLWKKLKELDQAELCFREAVRLKPDFGAAYTNLAVVLHTLEKNDDAVENYCRAVELGHQTEMADHMIAALTGSIRTSVPENYARDLFDSYAEGFDESLMVDLEYNTPLSLKKFVKWKVGDRCRFEKGLDLGCGTGLAGESFKEHCNQLVGIDVSPKMLEKAEKKGVYDSLHCLDITDFLLDTEEKYDLIIAADVLNYIGDIANVLRHTEKCMKEQALFVFSVEKLLGDGGCRLQKSGRYAHSIENVEKNCESSGLHLIACRDSNIRKDRGEWLEGGLFILQKL